MSALFGAVSGASTSTAAAIGSVAYPELEKRGYDPAVVVGTLAAGGTLGLLIPPSLSLLIYGATQQVSIGQLFLAGLLPGLMLAVMMMLFIGFIGGRREGVVPEDSEYVPLGRALLMLLLIWPIASHLRGSRHDLHGPGDADRGGGPGRGRRHRPRLPLGRPDAALALEGLRRSATREPAPRAATGAPCAWTAARGAGRSPRCRARRPAARRATHRDGWADRWRARPPEVGCDRGGDHARGIPARVTRAAARPRVGAPRRGDPAAPQTPPPPATSGPGEAGRAGASAGRLPSRPGRDAPRAAEDDRPDAARGPDRRLPGPARQTDGTPDAYGPRRVRPSRGGAAGIGASAPSGPVPSPPAP